MTYRILPVHSEDTWYQPSTGYQLAFEIAQEAVCNNIDFLGQVLVTNKNNLIGVACYDEDNKRIFFFEEKNATRFNIQNALSKICSEVQGTDEDGSSTGGDGTFLGFLPDICNYVPESLQPICDYSWIWLVLTGLSVKNVITKKKKLSKAGYGALGTYAFSQYLRSKAKKDERQSIGKMHKTKFVPVFKSLEGDRSKFNLKGTQGKSGCYIIKENGKIVYVGYSGSNLYKTITRHFQDWNDRSQDRITYDVSKYRKKYTIRIVFASPTKAKQLEKDLILKYQPRDNKDKYEEHYGEDMDRYSAQYEEYQTSDFIHPFI